MQHDIGTVRRQAAMANSVSRQTEVSERKILDSAIDRLEAIESRMASLRATAIANQLHGREYVELTEEKGKLLHVISMAKHHLGDANKVVTVQ